MSPIHVNNIVYNIITDLRVVEPSSRTASQAHQSSYPSYIQIIHNRRAQMSRNYCSLLCLTSSSLGQWETIKPMKMTEMMSSIGLWSTSQNLTECQEPNLARKPPWYTYSLSRLPIGGDKRVCCPGPGGGAELGNH